MQLGISWCNIVYVHTEDGGGLLARFYKTGKITFYYRFRWEGKQAILTIGTYPSVSLKEARERHREARKQLEDGIDPRSRGKKSQYSTVQECAEFWFREELIPRRKRHALTIAAIRRHVFPKIGNRNWDTMKTIEWVDAFKSIKGNTVGVRMLQEFKQCAKYLMVMDVIQENRLVNIQSRFVGEGSKPKERVFSMAELKQIYDFCHSDYYPPEYAAACLILMFTGARSGELRTALKKDVNLEQKLWTVRRENSKTGRPIIRPIPDFLYPHFKFLYDLHPKSQNLIISNRGEQLKVAGFFGRFKHIKIAIIPDFAPHVFRHTLATHFGDLKIEPYVGEKMLAHEMAGEMKTYNKGQYLAQQLEAMNIYHDAVRKVTI